MYLVNESSKLEQVNRVYKIREKSQSLLDHPRMTLVSYLFLYIIVLKLKVLKIWK